MSNIRHPVTGEWGSYDAYRREQERCLAALDGLARSDLVAPRIIRDDLGMRGVLNHVDGRTYDSRSAYYEAVREAGRREGKQYEVVGDDKSFERPPKKEYKPEGLKEDIKAAYDRVVGT
jgi:hypothetical protein